ncbi:MAG: hypothetical protein WC352_06310 [Candidatus Omnitrophota bacterium]|jgi:hypothetical protein
MTLDKVFQQAPFEALFFLTVLVVLIAIEAGLRYGRASRKRNPCETDAPIGTLVGAMLGLLAFILAFTFGMAGSNFEARRMGVLKESNAIGTLYLRADFIPQPARSEIRDFLREYVRLRLTGTELGKTEASIRRSEEILDALWARAAVLADKNPPTVLTGLFVQALNEVIDVHSERVMLGQTKRIPGVIWLSLYFMTGLSMLAVGYQFGIDGTRSVLGAIILALTFSAVIVLIADLDSPRRGLIKNSQDTMLALQKQLEVKSSQTMMAEP